MAIWIDVVDRRPKIGQTVLVEMTGGDFIKKEYSGLEGWWIRHVLRWLDEETLPFNLLDMRASFKSGQINGFEKCSQGMSAELFTTFMKREYNIELPD